MAKEESLDVDKHSMEQACTILCREARIFIPSFSSFTHGSAEDFFKKAKVPYRPITLDGKWWKDCNGDFLGFYKDSGQPVVLLERGNAKYELLDLSSKSFTVDEAVQKKLSSRAFIVYPSAEGPLDNFGKIMRFCSKGTAKEFGGVFLSGFLVTLIGFFFPFANKVLFDTVLSYFSLSLFIQVLLGLLLAILSTTIFMLIRSLFVLKINGIFQNNLQMVIWEKIFKLPLSFFRKFAIGDLLQRTMILDEIRRVFNSVTIQIIANSFFALLFVVSMLMFSFELTFMVIFVVLISLLITLTISAIRVGYIKRILAINAKINGFLIQVVQGISKLRVAEAINKVFSLWADEFVIAQKLQYANQNLQVYLNTWIAFLRLVIPFLLFLGVTYVLKVTGFISMTIGEFLGFYTAMNLFLDAFFDMSGQFSNLVHALPYWQRSSVIVKSSEEESVQLPSPGSISGQIKVENLFYRYDPSTPYILENVNLDFPAGAWISITGPSGCGKSTLCKLLAGLEKAQKGMITFDGKDILGISLNDLREQMSFLLQSSSAIFSGSIYENITCGNSYSQQSIEEQAKLIGFSKDLLELPMGLNTLLPSGGIILSGGQKQRLLLTRALLRKPKILVLDEALNNLDRKSQEKVLNHLKEIHITRIVISHSPKLEIYADQTYTFIKNNITRIK